MLSRYIHALSMCRRAEDIDFSCGSAVRFETFVCLLAVVESRAEAVDL
jgi:hypothetical protein